MSTLLVQQYLNELADLKRVSGDRRESVVREAFKSLCGEKKTQERIQYTLKTGKPLRN